MYVSTIVVLFASLILSILGENDQKVTSFYDFNVETMEGEEISLRKYKNAKVIIIVNTASYCGYTDNHYKELQILYDKYHANQLEILAFPSNQFHQEADIRTDILSLAQDKYQITFPIFAPVYVNGNEAHPLFTFLQTELPGYITNSIKWNFTKFLIVDGIPYKRYAHTVSPMEMENDIQEILHSKSNNSKEEKNHIDL